MATLTFNPNEKSDIECPPLEDYILELVDFTEFKERAGWRNNAPDESIRETYSEFTFRIVDFDYDPEIDDRDWNGLELRSWLVFFREDQQKGTTSDTWANDGSNTYPFIAGLLGHVPEKGEDIDMDDFRGKKIKAKIEPNKKGYPTIKPSSVVPYRRRRSRAADEDQERPKGDNPYEKRESAAD